MTWTRTIGLALLGISLELQLAAPSHAQAFEESAQALIEQARTSLAQGDYTGARRGFSTAVELIEQRSGQISLALVEPLTGLAETLAAMQHRRAAIEALSRAVAILRRSAGLYDSRQYALLRRMVDLHSLIGDIDAAAANLNYMKRVSESTHGWRSAQHAVALAEIADWQCRIGRFIEARQHYRQSVERLDARAHTDELVRALRGFARCCLEELSAEGVATSPGSLDRYRGPLLRTAQLSPDSPAFHLHVTRLMRYEGEQALRRAVQLAESAFIGADERVSLLLQTGDWFQIKNHRSTARKYYAKAAALLKQRTTVAEDPLGAPVQVLYPVPPLALRAHDRSDAAASGRFVEVEFTVRSDGRVENERVAQREGGKFAADETLSALRVARFRPRVVDGKTVQTEGVRFRQEFR